MGDKIVIEENKQLIDQNALLKAAIQQANLKIEEISVDKEQLEESLEIARNQRNSVSEIGHNREVKLQEKISTLEQGFDQIKSSSSSVQAILQDQNILENQLEQEKIFNRQLRH